MSSREREVNGFAEAEVTALNRLRQVCKGLVSFSMIRCEKQTALNYVPTVSSIWGTMYPGPIQMLRVSEHWSPGPRTEFFDTPDEV